MSSALDGQLAVVRLIPSLQAAKYN